MPVKNKEVIAVLVDSDVKKQYRKLCIDNGTNMSEPICAFIREYINEHSKRAVIS